MNVNDEIRVRVRSVERELRRYLPPRRDVLTRAMRYSLFSGGKRLRSVLLLTAGEAAGGRPRALLPFACGIEIIHAYSLVHDDLPAMDDDDLRRGKPTTHRAFDEATAILAGDALLTEAFRVMTSGSVDGGVPPRVALEAVALMATAAGAAGMVAGQAADLENEGRRVGLATVNAIHRRKTGALFEAAARVGGLVGGADAKVLRSLTAYGRALGLALQIADDVRDAEASTTVTGKARGRDQALGKATYATVLGARDARNALSREVDRAIRAIEPLRARSALLKGLAHRVAAWGAEGGASPRPRGRQLRKAGVGRRSSRDRRR